MLKKNVNNKFFVIKKDDLEVRFKKITIDKLLPLLASLNAEGSAENVEASIEKTVESMEKTIALMDVSFRLFWGEDEPLSEDVQILEALQEFGIDFQTAVHLLTEIIKYSVSQISALSAQVEEKKS